MTLQHRLSDGKFVKLGRRPINIEQHAKAPKLADYLRRKDLPAPPAAIFYESLVKNWPMMLNDQLGDCVCAAAGHMIEQWTTYAGKAFTPSDGDILALYEKAAGYVPGDPSTDNGAVITDVLDCWKKSGVAGHGIAGYVALNPLDPTEIKKAIEIFGNVFIGVNLPLTAQNQSSVWTCDNSDPNASAAGSWGGHAVPLVGYDTSALPLISWGTLMFMTWNFMRVYCDEAYAVVSTDWIEKNKAQSPSGLNYTQLVADLSQVAA